MTRDKGIFIKNIYYMLAYAFQVLRQKNYEEIEAEEFETIQDLFAAILARGISQQLKQGLYREYTTRNENLSVLRGKLNIHETIRNRMQRKMVLSCEYDELTVNNIFNQILKTTVVVLIQSPEVKSKHKAELKKILLFFDAIDVIDPAGIPWSRLTYQRNNRTYEMLINVCYFVLDGMIQTTENGRYKMAAFSEKHMHRLFEKFVLEYYKRHHSYLSEIRSAQMKWNLSEDAEESMLQFLPIMQTDIFLKYREQVLIIDTKYYGKIMSAHYDRERLRSQNLYQIFTYVKNQDVVDSGKVSGLLLYAKTEEAVSPDFCYVMGKNRIGAKTLDLNKEFREISVQLDQIVEEYFDIMDQS